jgi:hypothetical protein
VAPKQAGSTKADEKADPRKRLAAARLDTAKTAYGAYWARYEAGHGPEEAVHLWSRRWLQAQLDLSDKKADRDAALAAYQERLKKADAIARARLVLGNARSRASGLWRAPRRSPTGRSGRCTASRTRRTARPGC